MYINFIVLEKFLKKGWSLEDFLYLCAVKNQDKENSEKYGASKEKFIEEGYVKLLKKGEERLDKKGTDFLNKLGKSDKITPETEKLSEWIANYYKNKKGGIVRSLPNIKRRCQSFCDETGFYGNKTAILIYCFINDSYDKESGLTIEEFKEQNPRMVLSYMAENIFYSPPSHFSKHFNLDDSPLYQYYLNNKKYIEQQWKKNGVDV